MFVGISFPIKVGKHFNDYFTKFLKFRIKVFFKKYSFRQTNQYLPTNKKRFFEKIPNCDFRYHISKLQKLPDHQSFQISLHGVFHSHVQCFADEGVTDGNFQ